MRQLETNDLFKGAYLLSQSFTLKETKFVEGHQVRFVIEGEDIMTEDMRYHTGQALVDPLRLKECVKILREILSKTLRTYKPRRIHVNDDGRHFKTS
ncbi:hypothetical protein KKA14_07290 [bacterium]|nr:hypothetical protein [bacterium]